MPTLSLEAVMLMIRMGVRLQILVGQFWINIDDYSYLIHYGHKLRRFDQPDEHFTLDTYSANHDRNGIPPVA